MIQQSALVIGAGVAGIATAHYLALRPEIGKVTIVDRGQPMAFTSAQSGENYRNWWPHPVMTAFTDLSISLMEEIDRTTGGGIGMSRRGYALATRRTDIGDLVDALHDGYADAATDALRFHGPGEGGAYVPPVSADRRTAPDGVDIITNRDLIRRTFPSYDSEVAAVIHVRRAGSIDSSRLGRRMLEIARGRGAEHVTGTVEAVAQVAGGFKVEVATADGPRRLTADLAFNAAGPFVADIGRMIGYDLPVRNVRQQKIAFEDRARAIPRDMPFSIDLDGQEIDWGDDDRALMLEDDAATWLAGPMPGRNSLQARRRRTRELGQAGVGVYHGAVRAALGTGTGRQISRGGASRCGATQSRPEGLLRTAAAHDEPLRRLLHDDQGELAARRPGGAGRQLRRGGPVRLRHDGGVRGGVSRRRAGDGGGGVPDYAALLGLARYDDPEFVAGLEKIARSSVL